MYSILRLPKLPLLVAALAGLQLSARAQCVTNLLTNSSFESPSVGTVNGNNLVGNSWSGWTTQNGAGMNIIRVNGSNYLFGPNNAAQGTQYLDIAGNNDYPTQSFTLATPSKIYFNGKFANRESVTNAGFAVWTARVDILNSSNAIVASSNTKDMVASLGDETWFMLGGESAVLPAGTYKFRAYTGDFGHFDDAFVGTVASASACNNRIPEASFETPAQATPNTATAVGTSVGGWYTQNGSTISISKVNGSIFNNGPDAAYDGTQYLSLSNTGDYLVRNFTLTCATTLSFSGYFASKPNATYSNWTGQIEILNSSDAVVASSTSQAFTSSSPLETWYQVCGTSATLPGGAYKYRVSLGRDGNFDAGYLCMTTANCSSLPVLWQSFTARRQNRGVVLDWQTGVEQNTLGFAVQHSTDGKTWKTLTEVPAAGAGKLYGYVHTAPAAGYNHYRIAERSTNDGKATTETRVVFTGDASASFALLSSVVENGQLHLQLATPQTVGLHTADGRLVLQKKLGAGSQTLDLSGVAKGLYWLRSGTITEKIVVR